MNIRVLNSEELSHELYVRGGRLAKAEQDFFIKDEQRKILLSELALGYEKDNGVTKAQNLARVDQRFRDHVESMAEIVRSRSQAKVDYKEVDYEIKRRLNLSFAKNREWNAEKLNT